MKKRRIYDITNVMEGVGLIEKQSKNLVRWTYAVLGGRCTVDALSLAARISLLIPPRNGWRNCARTQHNLPNWRHFSTSTSELHKQASES